MIMFFCDLVHLRFDTSTSSVQRCEQDEHPLSAQREFCFPEVEVFILHRLKFGLCSGANKKTPLCGSGVFQGVANVYEAEAGSSVGGEAGTKRSCLPRRR